MQWCTDQGKTPPASEVRRLCGDADGLLRPCDDEG
jgi:hypothetical protein